MKLTKKVIMLGNSLGIVLDKVVLEKLKIKKGDLVEVEFKKCQLK